MIHGPDFNVRDFRLQQVERRLDELDREREELTTEAEELREEVEQMTARLDGDERRLRRWLRSFYWLSLLPFAAALVVMVWLYGEPLGSVVQWVAGMAGI